ncbi:MAG: glycosyltransferase, partial [Acidianus infernus]|nr:glycosyltransferase [Acidianus infernus]
MKISVVIPTLNSEKTIKLAVSSSLKLADEVIVVDSFSTDRTVEIAEREGAKVLQVKGSRLIARIEGAKHAKGEYVVNLDSDMYFSENFKGFEE